MLPLIFIAPLHRPRSFEIPSETENETKQSFEEEEDLECGEKKAPQKSNLGIHLPSGNFYEIFILEGKDSVGLPSFIRP